MKETWLGIYYKNRRTTSRSFPATIFRQQSITDHILRDNLTWDNFPQVGFVKGDLGSINYAIPTKGFSTTYVCPISTSNAALKNQVEFCIIGHDHGAAQCPTC